VEAALSAGLAAAGLPGDTAVSAVLLYRVTTFWLPVIPGWLAFHALQRANAV
jgi:glycosyltransferase 2 family protein